MPAGGGYAGALSRREYRRGLPDRRRRVHRRHRAAQVPALDRVGGARRRRARRRDRLQRADPAALPRASERAVVGGSSDGTSTEEPPDDRPTAPMSRPRPSPPSSCSTRRSQTDDCDAYFACDDGGVPRRARRSPTAMSSTTGDANFATRASTDYELTVTVGRARTATRSRSTRRETYTQLVRRRWRTRPHEPQHVRGPLRVRRGRPDADGWAIDESYSTDQ